MQVLHNRYRYIHLTENEKGIRYTALRSNSLG